MAEKKLKLRKIKFNDSFELSRIIDKLGIKFEKGLKTDVEFGADFILKIMSNAHKAQKEVNNFLGDLFGITGEEFGELEIDEVNDCMDQLRKAPEFENFTKSVAKLIEMK